MQEVLQGHNRPHYRKHEFAFRGLLTCAHDDCLLTAEIKKQKYICYRCTFSKGKCALPYIREVPAQRFAHLLAEDPKRAPQELLTILHDEQESAKRLKSTEYAAAIHPDAGQQRGGMMATLNMVANALKLLPRPEEAQASWTASSWAKQRQDGSSSPTRPNSTNACGPSSACGSTC